MLFMIVTGCTGARLEAAPGERSPSIEIKPIAHDAICVTKGEIANQTIREPTVRAFARGAGGDAAQLKFTYGGESETTRDLASGEARHQLGLKLRAEDSCNVVYVMWRLDLNGLTPPKPKLAVSVKRNRGKRTHEECGAEGYTKVKPAKSSPIPVLEIGATHTLRAEIVGDELFAWIDGKLSWQGHLPEDARDMTGPAGLRSDNVRLEVLELAAPLGEGVLPACKRHEHDD
ncbi:MAG: hypothetical protein JWO36_1494 [Myxococcales bacterium]|nr:hypothetical protein [Myxococcales bacterium]